MSAMWTRPFVDLSAAAVVALSLAVVIGCGTKPEDPQAVSPGQASVTQDARQLGAWNRERQRAKHARRTTVVCRRSTVAVLGAM